MAIDVHKQWCMCAMFSRMFKRWNKAFLRGVHFWQSSLQITQWAWGCRCTSTDSADGDAHSLIYFPGLGLLKFSLTVTLPAASEPWWGGPAAHKGTASPVPPGLDSAEEASAVSSPVAPLIIEHTQQGIPLLINTCCLHLDHEQLIHVYHVQIQQRIRAGQKMSEPCWGEMQPVSPPRCCYTVIIYFYMSDILY